MLIFVGCAIPVEVVGMESLDGSDDVDAGLVGVKLGAVGDVELGAATGLTGIFLKAGLEGGFAEVGSGEGELGQLAGQLVAVDPGSTEEFEGAGGAAGLGDVGAFEQAHAGVNDGGIDGRHVG